MRLADEAIAHGYRLVQRDATGSTNDDALAAARGGDPGRLWIVADRQEAGRGRHGRAWASPPGNLHASLLLVDPCPPARAVQLGFLAGLALHDAVGATTGLSAPRLALKWPNDLLLDGAKTSGLLLEGHTLGRAFTLVIGIGVNVVASPPDTPYPVTSLTRAVAGLTRDDLFTALSGAFAHRFQVWTEVLGRPDPFADLRSAWLARAAGVGATATVRLPNGPVTGRFKDLDAAGRLLLDTPTGLQVIDAGDLFFPNHSPS